jgi:hypothetical protein
LIWGFGDLGFDLGIWMSLDSGENKKGKKKKKKGPSGTAAILSLVPVGNTNQLPTRSPGFVISVGKKTVANRWQISVVQQWFLTLYL